MRKQLESNRPRFARLLGIALAVIMMMGLLPIPTVHAASVQRTLATLGSAVKNDWITIDNRDWVVVKTQDYQGERYVYLLMCGYIYDDLTFGPGTDYNASASADGSVRNRMKKILDDGYLKTIRAIAIKPGLGTHSSTSAKTSIFYSGSTVTAAGSTTQDILFAPSIADMHEWIGSPGGSVGGSNWWVIPSGHPLYYSYSSPGHKSIPMRFYCRTSRTSAEVYGVLRTANSIDGGIHYLSGYATDVPCVWVNSGAVNREVKVYYVDTNGNPIPPGGTTSKTYNVIINDPFTSATLTSSEVPKIPGYTYKGWQKSAWNAPTSGLPNGTLLSAAEVIAGTSIYLVYEKEIVADVTITKTVDGPFADLTKPYDFTVTFKDSSGALLPADTQFDLVGGGKLTLDAAGSAPLSLGHGQAITIQNVPSTHQIQIAEAVPDSYAASFIDSGGSPGLDSTGFRTIGAAARTFEFTNTHTGPPPMGIGDDLRFVAVLLTLSALALLAGAAAFVLKRKRVWNRD